ncbi:MAG: squalene/phytoene synthase family protein [Paracoccaceae bacterium]
MTVQACAEIVQKGDPDRFLATMAAPPHIREILFPIYAFNVEVSRAPWVTEETMIAEMRLQWWRDALAEIGQGGTIRRHEIITPLASVLDKTGTDLLDGLVNARRWDVYKDPFENKDHFDEYLTATAGNLMWAAARAIGATEGEQTVTTYGAASGLANWFKAVPELEARSRIPLVDGRPAAVIKLANDALIKLKQARKSVPKSAYPATRTGWLADRTLRSAAATPADVIDGRLHNSEFSRKFSLLLRVVTGSP